MVLDFSIPLLALIWHAKCSPVSVSASTKPGTITQPGAATGDLIHISAQDMRAAQTITNPECPVLKSLLQGQTPPTSETISTTRLVRRGRSTTGFGTVIETVPFEAQTSATNIIRLDYAHGWHSHHVQILDSVDDRQHLIPGWLRLDGTTADLTIQAALAEIPPGLLNLRQIQALSERFIDMYRVADAQYKRVFPDSGNVYYTQFSQGLGWWTAMISPFHDVDGFSFTMRRYDRYGQTPLPAAGLDVRPRALGVALSLFLKFMAHRVERQITNTIFLAHTAVLASVVPTSQDAGYVLILLQVLNDLLRSGATLVDQVDAGPQVSEAEIDAAMAMLGSGAAKQVGGSKLMTEDDFALRVVETRSCDSGHAASGATA